MEIFLYDEGTGAELDIEEIAGYLTGTIDRAKVTLKGNIFSLNLPHDRADDYARRIAGTKVQGAHQKLLAAEEPLYGEIEFEKRRILGKTRSFGILYDGWHLLRIFRELIPEEARRLEVVHILFTNRLFATWDDNDRRYHIRTSIYGIPSIISTTGLVQAPAKPREYYLLKQQYDAIGKDLLELNDQFRGRFIDYEDQRLTEVVKGYALQAVVYTLTGDPFCQDKGCRLYNAHWQEEVIFAQLESDYEFCPRHSQLLKQAKAADS